MDPVSQAALGAAWAQPAGRGSRKLAAAALGAAAGMAADLDLFIRSGNDTLLALEYHRHFTHSLVFIPVGALIVAALFHPLARRPIGFGASYLFCLLGFASHGVLDACTSFGTMLLWPFSTERIALHLISVVDPLFTLPLIAAVAMALRRQTLAPTLAGLAWCLVYLAAAAVQQSRAGETVTALAASRGHWPEQIQVKPSFANIVLWKSIYAFQDRIYIDAIRVGAEPAVIPGESFPRLDLARDFPWLAQDTQQWRDVARFGRFAEGFVAVDPAHPVRIVDIRYSLLPNRGDGFWAIELDPDADAAAHAAYVTMRDRTFAEGRELLRMIIQGERPDER